MMEDAGGGTNEMDSLYGESETKPKEKPESVDQEEREQMATTAIVPLKLLSPEGEPLKKGDEIVVKVQEVYDDEAEIAYAPKKGGGGGEKSADEEIDGMDNPGMY